MLDIDKIRQLVDMMVSNDLMELSLRDGDVEVNLRRPGVGAPVVTMQPGAVAPAVVGPAADAAALPPGESEDNGLVEIPSPMVGTYYASPDPESPPFVKVGGQVSVGTVVCILEAMKVFNEIKAEVSGTVERVLVKNEQTVEFGQPLFLVRAE